jgi:hypothetical protein
LRTSSNATHENDDDTRTAMEMEKAMSDRSVRV